MKEETTYSLATLDNKKINGIRILAVEEFEIISKQIYNLEKFHNEDALYNLIKLNYQDLKERCDFYLNQYNENPFFDFSRFSHQFIDINRIVLNLLSSIRTYLDHNETNLKRNFGKESIEFKMFKKLTSECFNNYFSYRFLSKLRNYSQHCGLPTGSMSIVNNVKGNTLRLSFVRDELLESFESWGSIVKPDLQKQSKEFDIIPLLQEKVELLKNINENISLMLSKKIKNHSVHLLELINETQTKGKGIPIILKISGNVDSPILQIGYFPYEVISRITGTKINVIYRKE